VLHDSQYLECPFQLSERAHAYGKNVHLLADPFAEHLLAKFSLEETVQPQANKLASELSKILTVQAINFLFPQSIRRVRTRMLRFHPEAEFEAKLLSPEPKVVVVDLMRAGILPSHICFEALHQVLQAKNLRQDHILLNRAVNEKQEVIGVQMSGYKIGGSVKDAFVFFPDPMGATGSTITSVIELYKKALTKIDPSFSGKPKKFVALHFIITPEYLKKVRPYSKELEVFALRLDRGLSEKKILQEKLGKNWNREKGLNDKQYIVPGAGGIGEILNNSFV
jgi:uracil phosphoribosyltransferase